MNQTEQARVVEYRDVPGFPGYRVGDDGSPANLAARCLIERFLREEE